MQGTELVVRATLCIASGGFSHFNEKFITRLFGKKCFGVWPKHGYFNFFEGGLLCVRN